MTTITAALIPQTLLIFLETPKNEQMPKNVESRTLLMSMDEINDANNIPKYSIIF